MTCRALARKNGYELNYNREIIGLGLANFAGAMCVWIGCGLEMYEHEGVRTCALLTTYMPEQPAAACISAFSPECTDCHNAGYALLQVQLLHYHWLLLSLCCQQQCR